MEEPITTVTVIHNDPLPNVTPQVETEDTEELQTVADAILKEIKWLKQNQEKLTLVLTDLLQQGQETGNLRVELRNNSQRLNNLSESLDSLHSTLAQQSKRKNRNPENSSENQESQEPESETTIEVINPVDAVDRPEVSTAHVEKDSEPKKPQRHVFR